MRGPWVLTIAVAVIIGCGVTASDEDRLNARDELATVVPEAIRLLEEKKYEDFVTTFLAPEEFKKIAKDKPLKEFADQFGKGHAAMLLQTLRAIEGKAPKLDRAGETATFKHDVKDTPHDTMVFVKRGKRWFIRN